VTVGVYGMTLANGFVYDDHSMVVANGIYRTFDLRGMLFGPANGLEYLPVRDLTYAVDYRIWGSSPAGFHLSNLIFYLAGLMVLYLLMRETARLVPDDAVPLDAGRFALIATLLFAVHPLHSEPVSLVFCRNVLVSGLFFFSACLAFAVACRQNRAGSAAATVNVTLLYLLSLFAKATAITLPFLLPLFALARKRMPKADLLAALAPPLAIMAVGTIVFRQIAVASHVISREMHSLADLNERLALAVQIPCFYLAKLFLPVNLTLEYDTSFATTMLDWRVIGAASTLAVLITAAIRLRRSHPELLFGVAWYVVTLLPVMNIFRTHPIVADRYAYLPSLGIMLIAAAGLARMQDRRIRLALCAALIALLALATVTHNRVFRTDISIWEHAVKQAPTNSKNLRNLGWSYFHAGREAQALGLFDRLKIMSPTDINADLARGYIHFRKKEWPQAIPYFRAALAAKSDALYPLYLIATCFRELGDDAQALHYFERILSSGETDASGYKETARRNIRMLQSRRPAPQHFMDAGSHPVVP